MILNGPEISKTGQDYADKATSISRAMGTLKGDADSAIDPNRKAMLMSKIQQHKSSKLVSLYNNLKKNAASIGTFGNDFYPVIRHKMSDDGNFHMFSSSPNFSKAFNAALPQLMTLGSINNAQTIGEGKKAKTVTPCLVNHGSGTSMNEYLSTKLPQDDLKHLKSPEISMKTVDLCDQPHCLECTDCKPHQDEMVRAVNGIVSHDPNTGDGMRSMHIKNLITTLDSWAAHHDSRGGDTETCNDRSYIPDRGRHLAMSTSLKKLSHELSNAYKTDYHNSGHSGGGIHRDSMGIGSNEEAY